MSPAEIALRLIEFAYAIGGAIAEAVTGVDERTMSERIGRARIAVRDPIDTSATDAERRAELIRVVRGPS